MDKPPSTSSNSMRPNVDEKFHGLIPLLEESQDHIWKFSCPETIERKELAHIVDKIYCKHRHVWAIFVYLESFKNEKHWVDFLLKNCGKVNVEQCTPLKYARTGTVGYYLRQQGEEGERCSLTIEQLFNQNLSLELDTPNVFKRDNFTKLLKLSKNNSFYYGENNALVDLKNLDAASKRELFWLNDVKTDLDILIPSQSESKILGVTTAMVNIASIGCASSEHLEDVFLYSMNYHFGGADRYWLFKHAFSFFKYNHIIIDAIAGCKHSVLHKDYLGDTEFHEAQGEPFEQAVQRPGEIVFTFSASVHAVMNTGNAVTSEKNWYGKLWKLVARGVKRCTCAKHESFKIIYDELYRGEADMKMKLNIPEDDFMSQISNFIAANQMPDLYQDVGSDISILENENLLGQIVESSSSNNAGSSSNQASSYQQSDLIDNVFALFGQDSVAQPV
uniref:JmjC domain-containing protein n=1 Tax=Panagrolaimus sp. PS1159 TaxID=55785 RepID=A0AC35GRE9_9BILA